MKLILLFFIYLVQSKNEVLCSETKNYIPLNNAHCQILYLYSAKSQYHLLKALYTMS